MPPAARWDVALRLSVSSVIHDRPSAPRSRFWAVRDAHIPTSASSSMTGHGNGEQGTSHFGDLQTLHFGLDTGRFETKRRAEEAGMPPGRPGIDPRRQHLLNGAPLQGAVPMRSRRLMAPAREPSCRHTFPGGWRPDMTPRRDGARRRPGRHDDHRGNLDDGGGPGSGTVPAG